VLLGVGSDEYDYSVLVGENHRSGTGVWKEEAGGGDFSELMSPAVSAWAVIHLGGKWYLGPSIAWQPMFRAEGDGRRQDYCWQVSPGALLAVDLLSLGLLEVLVQVQAGFVLAGAKDEVEELAEHFAGGDALRLGLDAALALGAAVRVSNSLRIRLDIGPHYYWLKLADVGYPGARDHFMLSVSGFRLLGSVGIELLHK
jgi:hypothetical protein